MLPLDEGFEVDVKADVAVVVVDEGLLGSIAMSSKDVESISSRRTLASLTTDFDSWRMCSPKRARRPAEVEVVGEGEVREDEDVERVWAWLLGGVS